MKSRATLQEIENHLSKFCVGIAGAGGLGSNCAVSLLRTGIGKLVIADFDIVESSNLNRQFYFKNQVGLSKVEALKENLLAINPNAQIDIYNIKLESQNIPELFKNCDVIVEAFDKSEMKVMIIETCSINFPEKPLIVGSGLAGWGNNQDIKTEQYGNLYFCGDFNSEVGEDLPPLAPRVNIVANMQANIVLEILMRKM
ncbi:MAG TPA: sulfur carrier protein ThiS adenylyltransferase ThiF [Bacteroidales bacterium]|nr:sulfur carrier protein ThiS adenylyltransferase ThiF [Bacteroidales bacterium]